MTKNNDLKIRKNFKRIKTWYLINNIGHTLKDPFSSVINEESYGLELYCSYRNKYFYKDMKK